MSCWWAASCSGSIARRRPATSIAIAVAYQTSVVPLLALVPHTLIYLMGAFIVLRVAHEHRRMGWLLATSGVFTTSFAATPVFELTGSTVAGVVEATAGIWLLPLLLAVIVYPTGRPESVGLRVLAWVTVVGVAAATVNWLGVNLGWWASETDPLEYAVAAAALPQLLSFVEQARIYPRRPLVQQKQVKWYVLGLLAAPAYLVPLLLDWSETVFAAVDAGVTMIFPLAILVGITRYRLFEIDRIVSRTVAYAAVIAALAGLGIGMVSVVTTLLPAQDRLAVAVTTVGVVVLFDPLRRRVVWAVDRRFDRSHYEAERVIEEFGRGVRATTDLGEVRDQLEAVLARTVAPATVAVWEPAGGDRLTAVR